MSPAFNKILVHLFHQVSVIAVFILIISRFKLFNNLMIKQETSYPEKIFLILLFGTIGIIGTYTGYPLKQAIANTRAMGVIVGGLMAGPFVGVGAGLIAGTHRYFLGGLTINAAFISIALQGYIAGMFSRKIKQHKKMWISATILTIVLEIMHMLIVLLITRPLEDSWNVVSIIGPPMIVMNAIGAGLFIAILETIYQKHVGLEANAAHLALKIARRTLPFLRKGLTHESAQKTANIIYETIEDIDGLVLYGNHEVSGYAGGKNFRNFFENSFLQQTLNPESTFKREKTLKENIQIGHPLTSQGHVIDPSISQALIPLKEPNKATGFIAFFKMDHKKISPLEIQIAYGLSLLISTQIEISKLNFQSELLSKARIKFLQAQINPHFLFNALNTIVYYCRVKPEKARELIIQLGNFYRKNLTNNDSLIALKTEISHVRSYFQLEKARFGEKIHLFIDIPEGLNCKLPPLTLQPIVENAVKHGILPDKSPGNITITGSMDSGNIVISVSDNGQGMSEEHVKNLFAIQDEKEHIGLLNVHERLKNLFGETAGLSINSKINEGTTVSVVLPATKSLN